MQNQSEEVDALFLALMEVHKEFGVILEKNAKGNRAKYANLPSILIELHTANSKHGLILNQADRIIDGQPAIETFLRHPSSKQWISSQSLLTPQANHQSADQAWGGSSTYHRRYAAMMLMGMFASDDPADHDGYYDEPKKVEVKKTLCSQYQMNVLLSEIGERKDLEKKICAFYKIKDIANLLAEDFDSCMAKLKK